MLTQGALLGAGTGPDASFGGRMGEGLLGK
jgi:hypothetical protein